MRLETNVTTIPENLRLVLPKTYGLGTLMTCSEDDPVTFLQEGNGAGPGGIGVHRYQVIFIPIGSAIGAFWTDLGPASDFTLEVDGEKYPAPPYHHLVLSEHTVAECRFYAERDRLDDFAVQLLHTQINESTLFADYARLVDEDFALVANRSVFGPHHRTERNGYSPMGASEQARRIAERTPQW